MKRALKTIKRIILATVCVLLAVCFFNRNESLAESLRESEYEEKSYCTATIDDNFDGSSVIVK